MGSALESVTPSFLNRYFNIVTYDGFASLIMIGSGLDGVIGTSIKITTDLNSSNQ
jgi:hypothetical protein